jgi:hypothetical protein
VSLGAGLRLRKDPALKSLRELGPKEKCLPRGPSNVLRLD